MKNKQIDRRDFMKGTAMATGGVMMAGLPVGASAFVNPQAKKLKFALVGCGGSGTGAAVQALPQILMFNWSPWQMPLVTD
jgi:myo-inositol 2-dehydrogenase/D-chiro-inositol 1-dehydrogenase